MDKKMLLDAWEYSASDEALSGIADLTARTDMMVVSTDDIEVLPLCRYQSLDGAEDAAVFHELSKDSLVGFMYYGTMFPLVQTKRTDLGEELYGEMEDTTGFMMLIAGEKYLVSRLAYLTLLQMVHLGGSNSVDSQGIFRDLHLAEALFTAKRSLKILFREAGGVRKIFAFFSPKYTYLAQEDWINAVVKSFRKAKVAEYALSNTRTDVFVALEEGQEDAPCKGLMLSDSDTGHAAITISSIWYVRGTYAISESKSIKHIRGLSMDEIVDTAKAVAKTLNSDKFKKTYDALDDNYLRSVAMTMDSAFSFMNPARKKLFAKTAGLNPKGLAPRKYMVDSLFRAVPSVDFEDPGKSAKLHKGAYMLPYCS